MGMRLSTQALLAGSLKNSSARTVRVKVGPMALTLIPRCPHFPDACVGQDMRYGYWRSTTGRYTRTGGTSTVAHVEDTVSNGARTVAALGIVVL
jgi:hypothetical protein